MSGEVTLLHDHADLIQLLGATYTDRLVYPHIVKDGFKNVLPLAVVDDQGKSVVLVKHGDAGIMSWAPASPHEFRVYGNYFDFNNDAPNPSLEEQLRELAAGRTLVVKDTLPISLFRLIQTAGLKLRVHRNPQTRKLSHHTISRSDVETELTTGLNRFRAAAAKAVEGYRHEARIKELLYSAEDEGFRLFDQILAQRQLDTLLVTSPFQMEELTGLPASWLEAAEATLIVNRSDEQLHLLLPSAATVPGSNRQGEFASVSEAVSELAQGQPAIEHSHADLRLTEAIGLNALEAQNASPAIHEWQERRAASQLPFYVLAANSARHALERTVAAAEQELNAGRNPTESELARRFDSELGKYADELGLSGNFRPYFRIIHAGERTLVPATPSDYRLSRNNQTIKFDMGTQVLDDRGRVRGCSDIARTICATSELRRFQDKLQELVLDRVIPMIRPGVTGAQVHAAATEALAEHDGLFRSWGVLPEGRSAREYARDCGHIINRQTICNIYFTPQAQLPVQAGMSGCVEFVWGVSDLIVATEEAYVVTEAGAIPITA